MTTKKFVVKNGLATGNIILDASSSNITANFVVANLSVPASANLGSNANVTITGGTSGQYLQTDGSGALSWVSVTSYSNSNVASYLPTYTSEFTAGNISVTGNVTSTYFIGNGSQLTGLPATYANSNVANYLPTYTGNITGNIVTLTGNITAINANLGNLVTANFFSGAGNLLSNIVGGNVTGQVANALVATTAETVTTNAQPNITSVGTLSAVTVTANVDAGNVRTDHLLYANGSAWSMNGIPQGSNTYVQFNDDGSFGGSSAFTFDKTTNTVTITGNLVTGSGASGNISGVDRITANYFIGAGNLLSNIVGGNVTGQVANALIATTITATAQPNISSVGTLTSLVVGNSTANVTITDTNGNGFVTATGNITAPYFIGNVIGNISGTLTVPGNNTAVLFNDAGSAGASDGFKFNKTGNILTLNGNITTVNANLGNLVTANYFSGAGNLLSNIVGGNVTGQVANALIATTVTANAQPNITSVGILTDLTISGNLVVSGATEYTNVTNLYVKDPIIEQGGAANNAALSSNDGKDRGQLLHYYTTGTVDAFMGWDNSNAEFAFGSNVSTSSEVVTFNEFGNIRAGYFLGNASQLIGTIANANYAAYAGNVVNASQSNITSVGTLVSLEVTGNISGANLTGNHYGNGSGLTNLNGSNVTSQVANALIATTVTANAQPNITSVGTLASLNVTANVTASYFIGNGSQLTGLPATYANSNVASYLPTYTGNITGNIITLTGNISSINANLGNLVTANYFSGAGNLLSNIVGGNVTGQVANALVATTVTANAQPNITSVGTLSAVTVTANVDAGNVRTDNLLYANGTAWTMSGTPQGSNTYVQFNDAGSFGGNAGLVFNKTTTTLTANNFAATSTANLGAPANITITGGASGQVLTTNGAGGLSWATVTSSEGTSSNAAFIFNAFTGNGVQDTFELSSTPDSIHNLVINYNGAMQLQESYTLSGANVTFDEAPAAGSKVEVLVLNGGGGGSGGTVDASALLSPFLLMGA